MQFILISPFQYFFFFFVSLDITTCRKLPVALQPVASPESYGSYISASVLMLLGKVLGILVDTLAI